MSESIKLSKLDHRAVLRNEYAGSPDLVEMGKHERIHMGQHDPPCTQTQSGSRGLRTSQVRWPGM